MLAPILLIVGLIVGWVRAARRGGGTADRMQYAVGHGLAFGLVGLALGILLARSGLFAPG